MAQPTTDGPLSEALDEQRRLLARTLQQENRLLREALEAMDGYVDPSDAYRNDGELWDPLGAGAADAGRAGFASQRELTEARNHCRALALHNEFAINGHENRISYIVGSGHRYQAAAKKDADDAPGLVARVQAVIDEFIDENKWHQRQQEIVRRTDRDGEAFLRLFTDPQGRTRVRFIEPWQVRTPERLEESPDVNFGVQTAPGDVEQVVGYWLDDGQFIDAADVQHRKANVDANVARGVPLFYPVRHNLRRAEKLLRNMAAVSDIQTAIALIRKHHIGTRSALEQLRGNLADSVNVGDASHYVQRFQPGSILDVHANTEYDFPARGLDAGRYVAVLQAILRAVASRLVMPEFMLTSDASNANYSSTLVAEGPAVKMFQRLQHHTMQDDRELLWRAIRARVEAGRLDAAAHDAVRIEIEPPAVAVRDRLEEARVNQILFRSGAMSVLTSE